MLVFAGIVAFYVLRAQPEWQRWLAVVAGVVLAAVVFASSARGREFWQFMLDARHRAAQGGLADAAGDDAVHARWCSDS